MIAILHVQNVIVSIIVFFGILFTHHTLGFLIEYKCTCQKLHTQYKQFDVINHNHVYNNEFVNYCCNYVYFLRKL